MNRKARRAGGGAPPGPPGDAAFSAAQAIHAAGDLTRAENLYRTIIAGQPKHADAWHHLGLIKFQLGNLADARPLLEKAAALRPTFPDALTHLGMVLDGLGDKAGALSAAKRAMQQAPGNAQAKALAAGLLCDQGRYAEGLALFASAMHALGNDPATRRNYALALTAAGEIDQARQQFQQALTLSPGWALVIADLAGLEAAAGQTGRARTLFQQATDLAPRDSTILGNYGKFLFDQGDLALSKQVLDQAIAIAPNQAQLRLSRAAVRLALGEIESGWQDYAYRHQAGSGQGPRPINAPVWMGERLPREKLLVWREQGVGDELLFATIYPDVIARAPNTTIECDPRLASLFARSFPGATIAPDSQAQTTQPICDAHIACGSLPALLRRRVDDFPASGPVFVPDPGKFAHWRAWLSGLGPVLKVGLCWRGRFQTADRAGSYTRLADWRELLALPNVQVISLQYGDPHPELAAFAADGGTTPLEPPGLDLMNDFDGCAALSAALDLVIAPGTAAAPLAAGTGVPVHWLTLTNDWNFLGAAHWPWHPNVHGHRKEPSDSWDRIIGQVTLDVSRRVRA